MTPLRFCMNPTSWVNGAAVPGGMADALVQPILPFLEVPYEIVRQPETGCVNTYFAHRSKYDAPREPGATSVFISHGIADKRWRDAPAVQSRFNWVFVSGPAWTKRLIAQRMTHLKIVEAGYTKLDPIFNGQIPKPVRDGRVRVVWAPTHGGGGERAARRGVPPSTLGGKATSWWHQEEIVALLPESEFDVVLAPHPRHRPDKRSTLAEYVGADVVIADGGSTIYEAWALDLPVVFPTWLTGDANSRRHGGNTFEADIYKNRLGSHAISPEALPHLVARAAVNGIGPRDQDFIEGIFPRKWRGCSGRRHAEALNDIATKKPVHHRVKVDYVEFRRRGRQIGQTVRAIAGSPNEAYYEKATGWERVDADH